MARDLLCIYEDEDIVRNMTVDQAKVAQLDGLLLHVSAPGKDYDCVSRSFAPKLSVAEDPVCGSGHCHIIPYWSERLGKQDRVAYQASRRGGGAVLPSGRHGYHPQRQGRKILRSGNPVNNIRKTAMGSFSFVPCPAC
ncbi:MAG: PhzF family phenazine biosynthesis protein [Solobacterium sp.]|nr:PhzF family phenazine biosynthesis protein [Solobacterium sp.]